MKLTGRQSTNIEVRQREFPRPMAGSRIGGEAIHAADAKQQADQDQLKIKATMKDKNNPFRGMLKSMDKFKPTKNPMAAIPIPTPRPDPNSPQPPKTFGK